MFEIPRTLNSCANNIHFFGFFCVLPFIVFQWEIAALFHVVCLVLSIPIAVALAQAFGVDRAAISVQLHVKDMGSL